MNTETIIDWECWGVEQAPASFVDKVMDAVQAEPRVSTAIPRSPPSARRVGMLAAVAAAVASLAALAISGRIVRRVPAPSSGARSTASVDAPSSASAGDREKSSTIARSDRQVQHAPDTTVDRKLRDAVHARIVPALMAHGIERDPHTGLTIPAGAKGPSHNLSKAYLQTRIREDFYPLAMGCYQSALAKQPALRGQIVVDFMIVGDTKSGGLVDQAKINDRTDIADAEFAGCIRESMLSMVFAPPENNGWISVTYPFQFSPGDDDEEATRDN